MGKIRIHYIGKHKAVVEDSLSGMIIRPEKMKIDNFYRVMYNDDEYTVRKRIVDNETVIDVGIIKESEN